MLQGFETGQPRMHAIVHFLDQQHLAETAVLVVVETIDDTKNKTLITIN